MQFKSYFTEGRNRWDQFSVNKGTDRWTFTNLQSSKRYFMKINKSSIYDTLGSFLRELGATSGNGGKTRGQIDHFTFASNLIKGQKNSIFVKSGMFDKIAKTWKLH